MHAHCKRKSTSTLFWLNLGAPKFKDAQKSKQNKTTIHKHSYKRNNNNDDYDNDDNNNINNNDDDNNNNNNNNNDDDYDDEVSCKSNRNSFPFSDLYSVK